MTVQTLLEELTRQFSEHKISFTPRLDAELIVSHTLNITRVDLYIQLHEKVPTEKGEKIFALSSRRLEGEPMAYLLGEKEFYGRTFHVSPSVLIPRPETEHVLEEALKWIREQKITAPRIVDLGTGSGCLGLSLLAEIPKASLLAVDISQDALAVARKNADRLSLTDRAHFICLDAESLNKTHLPSSFEEAVDIVVANPPYIDPNDKMVDPSVVKFEPWVALFSGNEGLQAIKSWLEVAAQLLRDGGLYVFEIGATQGPTVLSVTREKNLFSDIRLGQDLAGLDRWVVGRK